MVVAWQCWMELFLVTLDGVRDGIVFYVILRGRSEPARRLGFVVSPLDSVALGGARIFHG